MDIRKIDERKMDEFMCAHINRTDINGTDTNRGGWQADARLVQVMSARSKSSAALVLHGPSVELEVSTAGSDASGRHWPKAG